MRKLCLKSVLSIGLVRSGTILPVASETTHTKRWTYL